MIGLVRLKPHLEPITQDISVATHFFFSPPSPCPSPPCSDLTSLEPCEQACHTAHGKGMSGSRCELRRPLMLSSSQPIRRGRRGPPSLLWVSEWLHVIAMGEPGCALVSFCFSRAERRTRNSPRPPSRLDIGVGSKGLLRSSPGLLSSFAPTPYSLDVL